MRYIRTLRPGVEGKMEGTCPGLKRREDTDPDSEDVSDLDEFLIFVATFCMASWGPFGDGSELVGARRVVERDPTQRWVKGVAPQNNPLTHGNFPSPLGCGEVECILVERC